MSRALIILWSPRDRETAIDWIRKAPPGCTVEFKRNRRSIPQNKLMWSYLGDISRQVEWYGQKLSSEDWKDIFSASLRRARVVPGLDGGSFVPLGMRTSSMTKGELGDLIVLIQAFAAERGVKLVDTDFGGAPREIAR